MSDIIGALCCSACSDEHTTIKLGTIPEGTDKFYNQAGELVREITYPSETITMSTVLRDVMSITNGLAILSCGHQRAPLPLVSVHEYLILPSGETLKGEGLPAPDSHVSHRATFKTKGMKGVR